MVDASSELPRNPLGAGLVGNCIVHHDPAHLLELTPARADLLLAAAQAERRVVLHTSPLARMSPALVQALNDVQGRWVVEETSGRCWDGLSGRPADMGASLTPSGNGLSDLEPDPVEPVTDAIEVLLAASVRHRAGVAPPYGALLERFAGELSAAPTDFGPYEPADRSWNRPALASALHPTPAAKRLFVRGESARPMRGSILVRSTRKGAEEVVDAAVALPPTVDDLAEQIHRALATAAETAFVLFAIVLTRPGHADLTRRPGRAAPSAPAALLIGPPGVRDLGSKGDELFQHYAVDRIGRARTPSVLVRLPGDISDWHVIERTSEALGYRFVVNR